MLEVPQVARITTFEVFGTGFLQKSPDIRPEFCSARFENDSRQAQIDQVTAWQHGGTSGRR